MKAAPTNGPEPEHRQEKDNEQEQNRNFWIAVVQGTFIRISFAFADSTIVFTRFYPKAHFLKHTCRLDRFDDASRLDVAPTADLESAGTPSAQNALLRLRYEPSTARMDRNGPMHPYGRLW